MTTKVVNGVTIDITGTPEETAILAEWSDNAPGTGAKWTADQAATLDSLRSLAKNVVADSNGDVQALAKVIRGLVLALLDEVNLIRAALVHPITSITRSGTTATATTPAVHGLTTGNTVAIHGATLAAYNGVKTITVTSTTTFTFTVAGSPATPAVGTLLYAMGVVPPTPPRDIDDVKTVIRNKIDAGETDS